MDDSTPVVEREDNAAGGRYVIHLADGSEAELTYRRRAPDTLIVEHTFTPPAWRGRNVAQRLMNRLIADARAEGTHILPLCSFAVAQFRRHPEWADLLVD